MKTFENAVPASRSSNPGGGGEGGPGVGGVVLVFKVSRGDGDPPPGGSTSNLFHIHNTKGEAKENRIPPVLLAVIVISSFSL